MKVYIVSGLGAGFKVLEKLKFPEGVEPVFLDWLLPEPEESFPHYIQKKADRIEDSEDFFSFRIFFWRDCGARNS